MKWKVLYKCVCVCVCVVIEILLCFVLKVGTFTSPVLVLDAGPFLYIGTLLIMCVRARVYVQVCVVLLVWMGVYL